MRFAICAPAARDAPYRLNIGEVARTFKAALKTYDHALQNRTTTIWTEDGAFLDS